MTATLRGVARLLTIVSLLCVALAPQGPGQELSQLRVGAWISPPGGPGDAHQWLFGFTMGGTWLTGPASRLNVDLHLNMALRAGGLGLRWTADLGGRWHGGVGVMADWCPRTEGFVVALPLVFGAHGQPLEAFSWQLELQLAPLGLGSADGHLIFLFLGEDQLLPAGILSLEAALTPNLSMYVAGRGRFVDLSGGPPLLWDFRMGIGTSPS